MSWFSDGKKLLALAVIGAALLGAWMFAYDPFGPGLVLHRNRITGAVCSARESCWWP
jgi:hypothetical protein